MIAPENKSKRFSEEAIVANLKEHKAGETVANRCRKNGMSSASLADTVRLLQRLDAK